MNVPSVNPSAKTFKTIIRVLEPDRALCEVADIPVDQLYSNSRTDAESAQLTKTLSSRLKVDPGSVKVDHDSVYLYPCASARLATYTAVTASSHFLCATGSASLAATASLLLANLASPELDVKDVGDKLTATNPAVMMVGSQAMLSAWGVDGKASISLYFSKKEQTPTLAINQTGEAEWHEGIVNPSGITTVQASLDSSGRIAVASIPEEQEPVALQASLECRDGRRTYTSSDQRFEFSVPSDAFPSREALTRALPLVRLGYSEALQDSKGNTFQVLSLPLPSPLETGYVGQVVSQLAEPDTRDGSSSQDVKIDSKDGYITVSAKNPQSDGSSILTRVLIADSQQITLICSTKDSDVAQKFFDSAKLR